MQGQLKPEAGLNMRLNTAVTLGASIACAGLAVVLARGWIDDAVNDQYQRRGGAPVLTASAAPSVPVLVAEAELRFGDTLTPDTLAVVDYPEGSVPMGALSGADELFTTPGARIVALTRINAGEPILDFKVSLPGSRAALSQIIEPGMRAKAIRVSDAESVAGFVLPGDRVDVLYIRDEEGRTRYGLDMRSDVLLQNVRVLGVDQVLDDQVDGAIVAASVTLEVELDAVQKLALASETGTLSLALRAVGEDALEPTASMRREALLAKPAPVRVAKPWVRPKAPAPKAGKDTAKVVVIRGEERDEVKVVSEADTTLSTLAPTTLAGGTL